MKFRPRDIRDALIEALPSATSNFGETPDRSVMYVPPAHIKALRLESSLVVGARGVGKSFWTAALNDPALRAMLGQSVRELEKTQVHVGFSGKQDIASRPESAVFADLMEKGCTPYDVWRAVVVRWLGRFLGEEPPMQDWDASTTWVRENPEPVAKIMQLADVKFASNGEKGLIVFDALDRVSTDWVGMDGIVRDLLRVVLDLKSFSSIHAKVFLRDDQFARTVANFPDASKLSATKAELTWQSHDLHGLIWQFFCNAPDMHGKVLRSVYERVLGIPPSYLNEVWMLADEAKRDGLSQRKLFEELAGPWMGRDRRRGVPYVWSVSHLADGKGRTSPRSFIAAMRSAAEDSQEKYPDHEFALHYESIKRGVQEASRIRIDEITEDHPWVTALLEPLKGQNVPCEFSAIEERWQQIFPAGFNSVVKDRLPPQHKERGWVGLLEDLERLGIFEKMKDSRINMPDLYRVGFGLGRRGGVKPSKQS
jgi:hypothetical protein